MAKYTGAEGTIVGKQVFETLVKTYEHEHGKEKSYIKFDTIGFEKLDLLRVEGAVGVRRFNGSDGIRTMSIFIPINEEGEELPVDGVLLSKSASGKGLTSDPPACPPLCA